MLELAQLNTAVDRILSVTKSDPSDTSFSETDLFKLSQLLRDSGKVKWAERPRIYAILHLIGQSEAIEDFVADNIFDISLPFKSESRLPFALKAPTARKKFIEYQRRLLTAAADIEKKRGTHQSLTNGNLYYQTKAELGSGSFGWVDHVWSTLSLESFARKRIRRRATFKQDHEAITAFISELKILQKVSHHHLVEFVGSYTDANYVAIIMRPVAKMDLKEYLRLTPFPRENNHQLRKFFGCLAVGIRYLHRQNVRHKDIKPSNVLISQTGDILITDFGTALDWTENGKSTTQGSRLIGLTPEYCAPEVIAYEDRNTLSDVYSLGCVYFEMLTLLKGESIPSMRQFFSDNGMKSMILRTNLVVANLWLDKLLAKHTDDYDNEPITWIRSMIERSPEHRPSSEELAHWTVGTANASRFCCPSCMDEDEVSSQDESIPQQLRQSSMELERSESETSSQDITNGLDEFPTHPQTAGTIAHSTQMLAGVTEEKYKSSNKVKRKKSEEIRRAYVEDDSEDDSCEAKIRRGYVEYDSEDDYRPRSSEKKTSQYKIEQDIRTQEEAARILERERERAEVARAAEPRADAVREARELERAALKGYLPSKWNAHAEYAAQYMRKVMPDPFSYPGMQPHATQQAAIKEDLHPKWDAHASSEGPVSILGESYNGRQVVNSMAGGLQSERTPIEISTNLGAPLLQRLPENRSTKVERDQFSSSARRSAIKEKERMWREPKRKDNADFVKLFKNNTPVPTRIPVRMNKGSAVQQDSESTLFKSSKILLSPGGWTMEEDVHLIKLKSSDKTWSQIAQDFPGRTKSSIIKHWLDMHHSFDTSGHMQFTSDKARQEDEDELERQIQEMEEADDAEEKRQYELVAKRDVEKELFEKTRAANKKAEEEGRRLREAERDMERLEDERERKREEAENVSKVPKKSAKITNRNVPKPKASPQIPTLVSLPSTSRTVDPSYFGISTPAVQTAPPITSQAIPLRPRAFTAQTYPRPQSFHAAQTPAGGYGPPLSISAYYQPQPLITPSYPPPSRSSNSRQGDWSDWEFDYSLNRYKRIRDKNGYLQTEYYEDQDTAQIRQETTPHSSYMRYAATPQYSAQYNVDVAPQYTGPAQADYFSQPVPSRPLSSRLSGESDEKG